MYTQLLGRYYSNKSTVTTTVTTAVWTEIVLMSNEHAIWIFAVVILKVIIFVAHPHVYAVLSETCGKLNYNFFCTELTRCTHTHIHARARTDISSYMKIHQFQRLSCGTNTDISMYKNKPNNVIRVVGLAMNVSCRRLKPLCDPSQRQISDVYEGERKRIQVWLSKNDWCLSATLIGPEGMNRNARVLCRR